jgi:hypothetical protein
MATITTSSVLIEGIKRRASIPENQATFESADFLAFANEELLLGIVPAVMSLHEDYFLFEIVVPVEAGKTEYEIPSRAAGNKLRDLQYKPDPRTFTEMTRVGIGERFLNNSNSGLVNQYYVKNNKVVISEGLVNGELCFVIYIKPSQLVLEERVGVITNITDLGNGKTKVFLSSLPENFNTSIAYDFYKSESPSSILKIDITPDSINTLDNSITFMTVDIPDDLKKNDHVAEAGEASIAQIPNEFHPMLEQMVACRVLEAQGDTASLQNALLKLQQMNSAGANLIDNRIDDAPQKIIARHSSLRQGLARKNSRQRY